MMVAAMGWATRGRKRGVAERDTEVKGVDARRDAPNDECICVLFMDACVWKHRRLTDLQMYIDAMQGPSP